MKLPVPPEPFWAFQPERCRGCTHCLRVCPTQAIRIRRGKAEAIPHRCIHCGLCIRACPRGAWVAISPSWEKALAEGRAVAVLDPSVFWQFGDLPPARVKQAFQEIGFVQVEDMNEAYDLYAVAVADYLRISDKPSPAISSTCPAVVQLVQVQYPSLVENLVPVISPEETWALRKKKAGRNVPEWFLVTPCMARAGAVYESAREGEIWAGAIPIEEIFNPVSAVLRRENRPQSERDFSGFSTGGWRWCEEGGQNEALGIAPGFKVSGMPAVAHVLGMAESGLLKEISLIEAWACPGGCLGGPFTVQDPCLARYHFSLRIKQERGEKDRESGFRVAGGNDEFRLRNPLIARPGLRLDEDFKIAMEKLRAIDEMIKKLPGIDCGSCGCPTCLALAEDIVQGIAREEDCKFSAWPGEEFPRARASYARRPGKTEKRIAQKNRRIGGKK